MKASSARRPSRATAWSCTPNTLDILQRIAADIDTARSQRADRVLHLERGRPDREVLEALIRAAGRGVELPRAGRCHGGRALVEGRRARDAARWRASSCGRPCRWACSAASPGAPICGFTARSWWSTARVAWTGSMNMVDPRFFKQDAGVGEWVDAMVRIEGPVAGAARRGDDQRLGRRGGRRPRRACWPRPASRPRRRRARCRCR